MKYHKSGCPRAVFNNDGPCNCKRELEEEEAQKRRHRESLEWARRQKQMSVLAAISHRQPLPCRDFTGLPGSCRFGDACKFSHALPASATPHLGGTLPHSPAAHSAQMRPPVPQPPRPAFPMRPPVPPAFPVMDFRNPSTRMQHPTAASHGQPPLCRYFTGVPGSCRFGDECQFSHALPALAPRYGITSTSSREEKRQQRKKETYDDGDRSDYRGAYADDADYDGVEGGGDRSDREIAYQEQIEMGWNK